MVTIQIFLFSPEQRFSNCYSQPLGLLGVVFRKARRLCDWATRSPSTWAGPHYDFVYWDYSYFPWRSTVVLTESLKPTILELLTTASRWQTLLQGNSLADNLNWSENTNCTSYPVVSCSGFKFYMKVGNKILNGHFPGN